MNDQSPSQEEDSASSHKEIKGMFDGSLLSLFLRLTLPILAGMLFNLAYTVVDTLFISAIDRSDPSLVGGTGLIFPLVFLAISLATGISVGVSSLVARAIGERNNAVLNRAADSGVALGILLGLVIILPGYFFAEELIQVLGGESSPRYLTHATDYFKWILPGLGLMLPFHSLIGILQGEGLMKYLMRVMILGNLFNIILDPIFILALGMGVKGAALATVVGQSLGGLYLIYLFAAKKTRAPVAWNIKHIKVRLMGKIAGVGLPQALSQMVLSFTFLIVNRVVIGIDPLAQTAFSLVGRVDQLVILPIFALGATLLTVVGQNVGRGLVHRARMAWRTALGMALVSTAFFATIMVVLAPYIYRGFTSDPQVLRYAVLQTRMMEYAFLLVSIAVLARSVFQAMGKPLPALLISIIRMLGTAVPLVLLFVYVFDWGIYGVYLGFITGNLLTFGLSFIWLKVYWDRLESGKADYTHTGD